MNSESQDRLKIAINIWMFVPGTGGLQGHAEQLAQHLIRKGHDVTVITRAYKRVPEKIGFLYDREELRQAVVNGIPVRTIQYPRYFKVLHWLIAKMLARPALHEVGVFLFRLQAQIGNRKCYEGFDIIHHVGQATALAGFVAADAAKSLKIPFVVQPTCHPHDAGDSPIDLKLYRRAERVLVHTDYERSYLQELLPEKPFDVVANGIENRTDGSGSRFRKKYNLGESAIVLFVGRQCRQKGFDLATEAFEKLVAEHRKLKLVLMGPEGDCSPFESEGVTNLGFADEQTKHDALAACDILCVPSEGESFGLIFMEAGLYGKPVIARRLPVLEELLGDQAFLVGSINRTKNRNQCTVDDVVQAARRILDSESLRITSAEDFKRDAEKFIWSNVVRKFEDAYFKACRTKESSSQR